MKHIAIIATFRSGSNFLRETLNDYYVSRVSNFRGPMREFFNNNTWEFDYENGFPVVQRGGQRAYEPNVHKHLLERVTILSSTPFRYCFVVHSNQVYGYDFVLNYLKDNTRIIFLERQNKRDQFISMLRGELTDSWVIRDWNRTENIKVDHSKITSEFIDQIFHKFKKMHDQWYSIYQSMNNYTLEHVYYEDFMNNIKPTVSKLVVDTEENITPGHIYRSPNDSYEWLDMNLLTPYFTEEGRFRDV